MLTIHLEKLRFFAYHGLYDIEKKIGNEFELNIHISFKSDSVIIKDIHSTINYASIYEIVKEEMAFPRQLLETFITELAEKIKASFPHIVKVKISMYKITAPIECFMGRVGVEVERSWQG